MPLGSLTVVRVNDSKSTILKQMRHLSDGPRSHSDRLAYREIVYANTVQSMQVVVEALEDQGIQLPAEVRKYADLFASLDIQPG